MKIGPRAIFLLGIFGIDNFGNEASLAVMAQHIRRMLPEAPLCCVCPQPEKTEQAHGIPALPIQRRRGVSARSRFERLLRRGAELPARLWATARDLWRLRGARALVVPGTGILDDFQESPRGLPLALFKWCVCAKLFRVPVLFVSVGAGPIVHPVSRWLMKSAAQLATYRSYRDEISRRFMQKLGVTVQADAVLPDLVFAHAAAGGSESATPDRPLVIGVGLMAYFGWAVGKNEPRHATFQAYVEKITAFIVSVLDREAQVRLIIGDLSDRLAVREVVERVSQQRPGLQAGRMIAEPIRSLEDVLREMSQTDLVVCTRYHNLICALLCDKPVISLGYAEKNDVLMQEMGLGRYCDHIERFTLESLEAKLKEATDLRHKLEGGIRVGRALYRTQLQGQFDQLGKTLTAG